MVAITPAANAASKKSRVNVVDARNRFIEEMGRKYLLAGPQIKGILTSSFKTFSLEKISEYEEAIKRYKQAQLLELLDQNRDALIEKAKARPGNVVFEAQGETHEVSYTARVAVTGPSGRTEYEDRAVAKTITSVYSHTEYRPLVDGCPVCGAGVSRDSHVRRGQFRRLQVPHAQRQEYYDRAKDPAWTCSNGGRAHYFLYRAHLTTGQPIDQLLIGYKTVKEEAELRQAQEFAEWQNQMSEPIGV